MADSYKGSARSGFSQVTSLSPQVPLCGAQKDLEIQYHTARLLRKRCLLIKKKEQRMNYCQRSLRVLTLAVVQIYSMQEQSTLRNISQSVLCGSRHETKLTKHCEMYNIFHLTICNMTLLTEIHYSNDSLGYWTHDKSSQTNNLCMILKSICKHKLASIR